MRQLVGRPHVPTDAEPWAPLCMKAREWTMWRRANNETAGNRAEFPCFDCLAEFRDANTKAGTCNEPERPSGQLGLDLFHAA